MTRTPGPRLYQGRERRDAPIFEVCVHGQPVSAQAENREKLQGWKERIHNICMEAWSGSLPLEGRVALRVTHYCETEIGDVDNLTKPIQDALQDVIYANDRQVAVVVGERRDINGSFKVRHMSLSLATAFSDGRPFVHIRVWRSRRRRSLIDAYPV